MRTHQYRDIICHTLKCQHMNAEEIFQEIRKEHPQIGKATVYRNIEAMAEEGLIRRFPGIQGKTYYECNECPHAHLIDERTGIFCDFPIDNIHIKNLPKDYCISEIRIQIQKNNTISQKTGLL